MLSTQILARIHKFTTYRSRKSAATSDKCYPITQLLYTTRPVVGAFLVVPRNNECGRLLNLNIENQISAGISF